MSNQPREQETDEMLVQAVLAGDVERFGAIVIRHDAMVRRAIRRSIQSPHALEEAVQETWCISFRKLPELLQPARLASWLAVIAANCGREHRRRLARRVEPLLEAELATPEESHDQGWLWELIESMTPKFSEVLLMHYRDGLTYEEMANRLELNRSTVRGRVFHARQELRRRLEEQK